MKIKVFDGGKAPEYKTKEAAGADCYARISAKKYDANKDIAVKVDDVSIAPGKRMLIPLGFAIELPCGFEAEIRPRSGLSKKGVDCSVGTIDSDYRGEVNAIITNNTDDDYVIYNGDRICQMVINRVEQFSLEPVDTLSETERGAKGFGSTGIK